MERRLLFRPFARRPWPTLWPALLLALGLVPFAAADHAEPEFVPGPDNHTCSDFTPDGETWGSLKVDPPQDGEATSSDGRLTVTLDVDEATKVFDWTANEAIVGFVFVKAGSGGHYLYSYDPLEDADTGLTSPGAGSRNQISHISFCYDAAAGEPTCGEPGQPACPPASCGEPGQPACPPPSCGEPGQPACPPPSCGEPGQPACPPPTCEEQPDMEGCDEEVACPTGLTATPNQDGTITLDFAPAVGSDGSVVYRAVDDGDFDQVAELDAGDTNWKDSGSEAGTTYRYTVTAMFGDEESEDCPVAEATAIPDFPTVLAAGGAMGASLLAYAFARRKT